MDDLRLVTVIHRPANLLKHLHDDALIQRLVSAISLDPLVQVASLAVLHDDDHAPVRGDADGIVYLDHVRVVYLGLDADLCVYVCVYAQQNIANGGTYQL